MNPLVIATTQRTYFHVDMTQRRKHRTLIWQLMKAEIIYDAGNKNTKFKRMTVEGDSPRRAPVKAVMTKLKQNNINGTGKNSVGMARVKSQIIVKL